MNEQKNNLPSAPSVFVGREREIAQIERALANPDINIVTIYGVGGTGKTALARLVVERQRESDRFTGGIVWIDCRVDDSLPVMLKTIAQTLGFDIASRSSAALRDAVQQQLRSVPTLLVLDAYEVVAHDDEVLSFIGRLPKPSKAIIISRERARVPGQEIEVRLDSLSESETLDMLRQLLGPEQWKKLDTETLRSATHVTGGLPFAVVLVGELIKQGWPLSESITQLHKDTASMVREKEWPRRNIRLIFALVVSALLSLLVGLFSNLAATYLAPGFAARPWLIYGAMTLTFIIVVTGMIYFFLRSFPDPLAETIEAGLPEPKTIVDTIMPILRQIEITISEQERQALEVLAVFAHPVKMEAITAVSGIKEWFDPAKTLAQKAFVEVIGERYALHPVVRTFFRQQLAPNRLATLELRMVEYFLGHVRAYRADYDALESDWLNIQYAMERAYQNRHWHAVMEFVSLLGEFLDLRGYTNEYTLWLNRAIEASEAHGEKRAYAAFLHNLAIQHQRQGGIKQAIYEYQQSLQTLREIGDRAGEATSLGNLGLAYRDLGRIEEATEYYYEALAISREIGDRRSEANQLDNLGLAYRDLGRIEEATEYYHEALAISREIGDRRSEASHLGNLGLVYRDLGRMQEAIEYYHEALTIGREIGDRRSEANVLANLGSAYAGLPTGERAQNLDVAIRYYHQALEIGREIGDRRSEANALANLGSAYADLPTGERAQNLDVAIRYYHQALEIGREIGDHRSEANVLANLGSAYADLPTGERAQNLNVAIRYYHQALEILTPEMTPMDWAMTQNNLGNVYLSTFQVMGSKQYADAAQKAFECALEILDPQIFPSAYAAVQNNLANVFLNQYEHTGELELLETAIQALQRALRFRTHEAMPVEYAATQSNLGIAWQQLFSATGDSHNLDRAIDAFQQALQIYKLSDFPRDWLRVTTNLSTAYAEAGSWPEAKRLATETLRTFRGAIADQEALKALAPWYERMGDLAIQNEDLQFATRILAEAAYRFELQGAQVPAFITNRLTELQAQVGHDLFAIIWAEVRGILTPVLAQTLQDAGELMKREQFSEAVARFRNALDLLADDGKAPEVQRQRAVILSMRGICLRRLEQWEEALKDQERALQLFEHVRDFGGEARSLLEMGHLFELMNNYEDARLHYMDAYRLYRRADDRRGMATASEHLGRLEFRVRMLPQAVEDLEEARDLWVQLGERGRVAAIKSELEDARAMLVHQAAKAKRQGEDR